MPGPVVPAELFANQRVPVGLQRPCPLRTVLRVAPGRRMRRDVGLGDLGECLRCCAARNLGALRGLSCVERVNARPDALARRTGPFQGLGERDLREPAEAHVPAPAFELEAQDPRLRAALADLQTEARHRADHAKAGLREPSNLERRQWLRLLWHPPCLLPHIVCWVGLWSVGSAWASGGLCLPTKMW